MLRQQIGVDIFFFILEINLVSIAAANNQNIIAFMKNRLNANQMIHECRKYLNVKWNFFFSGNGTFLIHVLPSTNLLKFD